MIIIIIDVVVIVVVIIILGLHVKFIATVVLHVASNFTKIVIFKIIYKGFRKRLSWSQLQQQ